jgi:hypothetical protein
LSAEAKHYDQYQRNKNLLNEQCFDTDKSIYFDWIVTIYFYAAVHLIEMELAKHNQHIMNHVRRNKAVYAISSLKPICKEYETLYRQSRKARYECTTFDVNKIKAIITLFSKIEGQLAKAS